MRTWLPTLANLIAVAGFVWAAVAWAWHSGLEILEQAGPAEYAAVIAFFTGVLLVLNYRRINRLRPSVRFRELAGEIEEVASETPGQRFYTIGRTPLENRVILAKKLKRLGIETPPNPGYAPYWKSYLEKLHLYAKLGNIAAARRLWAMEEPPRPINWDWWDE